ncbi:MAG: DNA-binding protein [Candidatus Thiodiazotropha endolucinida]|nr:DNA-binding protein [Candidatus Thiodiazotropha taylori]
MARVGDVFKATEALVAADKTPTVQSLREALGTGSFTTI